MLLIPSEVFVSFTPVSPSDICKLNLQHRPTCAASVVIASIGTKLFAPHFQFPLMQKMYHRMPNL